MYSLIPAKVRISMGIVYNYLCMHCVCRNMGLLLAYYLHVGTVDLAATTCLLKHTFCLVSRSYARGYSDYDVCKVPSHYSCSH